MTHCLTARRLVAVVIAVLWLPASAQSSFLGISFELPFPGAMPECPKMTNFNMVDGNRIKEAGVCFHKESESTYTVYNTPDIGIGHLLRVETYDDKPLVFKIRFSKEKYNQIVDIFTARYGKPRKTLREPIRTGSGAAYESRTTIWDGGKLQIKLDEIGDDVRWSDGVIVNAPLLTKRASAYKDAAKAAADKL